MRFVLDHSSTIRKCTGVLECYVECSVNKGMEDSTTVQYCIFIHNQQRNDFTTSPSSISQFLTSLCRFRRKFTSNRSCNTSIEQFE